MKTDLRIELEQADLVELIGEDMLFLTLPVMEEAYLEWAAKNPYPTAAAGPGEGEQRA